MIKMNCVVDDVVREVERQHATRANALQRLTVKAAKGAAVIIATPLGVHTWSLEDGPL